MFTEVLYSLRALHAAAASRSSCSAILRQAKAVASSVWQSQPTTRSSLVWLQARCSSTSHEKLWGEGANDYKGLLRNRDPVYESHLNSPTRFQNISEREDRSDQSPEAVRLQSLQKNFIVHRGCQLLKNPDDRIIYEQMFWHIRPRTIIELGAFTGGSALWMADMLHIMDIESHIYSMDIDLSLIEEQVKKLQPKNLTFLEGDSNVIEKTFTDEFLSSLPHPWIVNEDAHTNIYGVLEHFGQFMKAGDYFVVEDLNPHIPCHLGLGRVYPEKPYIPSGMKALEVVKKFLSDYSHEYAVDSFYTDLLGYNVTHNWHGYIRRM